jgi:hypothetical protein
MNEYLNASLYHVADGQRVRATSLNTALDAIETGLDKLPSENNLKRGTTNYALDTGVANACVVALSHAPVAYVDGMQVIFKAAATNTGPTTLNVNGRGAKLITRQDGSTLGAGDIPIGKILTVRYNSSSDNFEVQGAAAGGVGTMAAQNASAVAISGGTVNNVTMSGGTVGTHIGAAAPHSGHETPAGAQAKVDTHNAVTAPHSATSAATASRLVLRDAAGRAKVAAPSAADDIARKNEVDAHATDVSNPHAVTVVQLGVTATAAEINKAADDIGVTIPRQKIIEIGPWDCDTTSGVGIETGLAIAKIVGCRAVIRRDPTSGGFHYPIEYAAGSTSPESAGASGRIRVYTTSSSLATASLDRTTGGFFDGANFSSVAGGYNRGWVILDYID